MIGLTGAHRAGKTTLAKLLAEKIGIPFLQLPPVVKQMGLSPKDIEHFGVRLEVQRAYLEEAAALYRTQPTIFITDRTPLDIAAYLLGDVRQDLPKHQIDDAMELLNQAVGLTSKTFSTIMFIPTVLKFEEHPDKPPMNPAYQNQIETLIKGLLYHDAMSCQFYLLGAQVTDLQDRLTVLMSLHERLCAAIANAVVGMTRQ